MGEVDREYKKVEESKTWEWKMKFKSKLALIKILNSIMDKMKQTKF